MSKIMERFNANVGRREQTKEVTIKNYGGVDESYKIMPMSFVDNINFQSNLRADMESREIIVSGGSSAAGRLAAVAKYTREFASIKERELANAGVNSIEDIVQGVLSDPAINALYDEIQNFTIEIRDEAEANAFAVADLVTD